MYAQVPDCKIAPADHVLWLSNITERLGRRARDLQSSSAVTHAAKSLLNPADRRTVVCGLATESQRVVMLAKSVDSASDMGILVSRSERS